MAPVAVGHVLLRRGAAQQAANQTVPKTGSNENNAAKEGLAQFLVFCTRFT
jgi:hypothetical protein